MIQRERDMEGDEFKDKESFVTQAYKDQMAELRKAEEEEKLRDGAFSMYRFVNFLHRMLTTPTQRPRRRNGRDLVAVWLNSTKNFSRKKPRHTKKQLHSRHPPRPTHRLANQFKGPTSRSRNPPLSRKYPERNPIWNSPKRRPRKGCRSS